MSSAESEVLASVLECGRRYDDPSELASIASDIGDEKIRLAMEAAAEIVRNGEQPDIMAVCAQLESRKIGGGDALRFVGGFDWLHALMTSHSAHRSSVSTHIRMVRVQARRRRVTEALKAAQESIEKGEDLDDILGALPASVDKAAHWEHAPLGAEPMEAVRRAMAQVSEYRKSEFYGIPYGFSRLDEVTGGIGPGEISVLCAHTGHGKTSLALQIAIHVAREESLGRPVLYCSGEMLAHDLWLRVGCAHGRVSMTNLRNNPIESDMASLFSGIEKTIKSRMWVHDKGMRLSVLLSKMRQFGKKHPGGLFVIDHLDHVSNGSKEGRAMDLHETMESLKAEALRSGVAVLLLAQFNRGQDLESRPTRRSLKGSSSIEQFADQIIIVHQTGKGPYCEAEIIVDKNRRGPGGVVVDVIFEERYTWFKER